MAWGQTYQAASTAAGTPTKAAAAKRLAKNALGKIAGAFRAVFPSTTCIPCLLAHIDKIGKTQGKDKIVAALAAVSTVALAYAGDGPGKAVDALVKLGFVKHSEGKNRSFFEKFVYKAVPKTISFVKQWPALQAMSHGKYFFLEKGNLLKLAPGRYKPSTTVLTNQPWATAAGKAALARAGIIGGLIELGGEVYKYATDPSKSFKSWAFASDATKATTKGVAKGVVGAIVVGKSTALGAAIGTAVCPGLGTAIGAGVGLVAGIALSLGADKLIDATVDWTWDAAGKAAAAVGDGAQYLGEKAKEAGDALWNGAANALNWAKSWW